MLTLPQLRVVHLSTEQLQFKSFEEREDLFRTMDRIMNPVLNAARTSATEEQIEAWLEALPLGYYRQTLRVISLTRFRSNEGSTAAHEFEVIEAPTAAPVVPRGGFRKDAALVIASGGYAAAINAAISEEGL
jgi:hypothetical protein